jgi:WhiB family redox-sensing transcriptional regulator
MFTLGRRRRGYTGCAGLIRTGVCAVFGGRQVEWWELAACRKADAETFFPRGRGVDLRRQVDAAKAVCVSCPVRKKCLSWALTMNVSGVWGGCSEYERRRLRATANAAA